VVIMRGGGFSRSVDYSTLAEDLASHGYVVVGFDAPIALVSSFFLTAGYERTPEKTTRNSSRVRS